MLVSDVRTGERIVSPFSAINLEVVEVRQGMYGLTELVGKDSYGDRHLLSLRPDESVKVAS